MPCTCEFQTETAFKTPMEVADHCVAIGARISIRTCGYLDYETAKEIMAEISAKYPDRPISMSACASLLRCGLMPHKPVRREG